VVVSSLDYDKILNATAHEEFPFGQEAKIAGSKVEVVVFGIVRDKIMKYFSSQCRAPPVSMGYTFPTEPNLADLPFAKRGARPRIHNSQLDAVNWRTATDKA
jgi:hypothetical protein